MADLNGSQTSLSLLARLQQERYDPQAWDEFVDRYGRMIYRWCSHWGLQQADAQDVTQDVLLALVRQMSGFRYDAKGRFRAWLKTVAYRAWCDFLTKRKSAGIGTGDSGTIDMLNMVPAQDDFLRRVEEMGNQQVLELAMARVRERVKPQTWEAFRLLALEQLSGAEVAERLGIPVGSVFMAKFNVQKMLKEELVGLDAVD
jgi:RNA polymerase sigma-70 factor (ECF subfamily)